jgi:hypothetical protein
MEAAEALALADDWMGEGMELARRLLGYAERLRTHPQPERDVVETADDLEAIVRREWNPLDETEGVRGNAG